MKSYILVGKVVDYFLSYFFALLNYFFEKYMFRYLTRFVFGVLFSCSLVFEVHFEFWILILC